MNNMYLIFLSIGHLVVDLGQGILPILTPVLAKSIPLSYFQVGIIALAFTFSLAIIQPIFGVLSDRFRHLQEIFTIMVRRQIDGIILACYARNTNNWR